MNLEPTSSNPTQMYKTVFKGVSEEMQMCIQNCIQCAQVCEQMIQYCLNKGGSHADPAHIRRLQDCVDICTTSARFMIRGSDMHSATCGVCAQACQACAEDCEKMADDEMMQLCAEICRRCADTCQKMSQHQDDILIQLRESIVSLLLSAVSRLSKSRPQKHLRT